MSSKAREKDSARKKIQAKQTRLKVASQASTGRSCGGIRDGTSVPASSCAARRVVRQWPTHW